MQCFPQVGVLLWAWMLDISSTTSSQLCFKHPRGQALFCVLKGRGGKKKSAQCNLICGYRRAIPHKVIWRISPEPKDPLSAVIHFKLRAAHVGRCVCALWWADLKLPLADFLLLTILRAADRWFPHWGSRGLRGVTEGLLQNKNIWLLILFIYILIYM